MTAPWKVLCVDDEKLFLSSFRRFFLDHGCDLYLADSTAEAWNILERRGPLQLILSDYRMPGENGLDFLLRVGRRWPQTVRFIVSGFVDLSTIDQALERRQIDYFIPKPWVTQELTRAVEAAVVLARTRAADGGTGPPA